MELLSEVQTLPFGTSGLVAGFVVLLSIIYSLIVPSPRYNNAKVLRVGKTNLQSWLTWSKAPHMSLGDYIKEGYYKVRIHYHVRVWIAKQNI